MDGEKVIRYRGHLNIWADRAEERLKLYKYPEKGKLCKEDHNGFHAPKGYSLWKLDGCPIEYPEFFAGTYVIED